MLQIAGVPPIKTYIAASKPNSCSHTEVIRLTKFLRGERRHAITPPQHAAHAANWQAGAHFFRFCSMTSMLRTLPRPEPPAAGAGSLCASQSLVVSTHAPCYWLA